MKTSISLPNELVERINKYNKDKPKSKKVKISWIAEEAIEAMMDTLEGANPS